MSRRATIAALLVTISLVAACGGDDEEDAALDDATTTTEAEVGTTTSEAETTTTESTTTESTTTTAEPDGADAGTTTPDDYAEQVCSSIDDWFVDVSTASEGLTAEAGALAEEPTAGKALVLAFLDEVIGHTEDLQDELGDAGVPDTPTGEEVASDLLASIGDVTGLFGQARVETEALPDGDLQAVGTGLQEIGATLQDSADSVGAGVERALTAADDPELRDALNGAPACRSLGAP